MLRKRTHEWETANIPKKTILPDGGNGPHDAAMGHQMRRMMALARTPPITQRHARAHALQTKPRMTLHASSDRALRADGWQMPT